MRRRHRGGLTTFKAGLIGIVALLLLSYLAYTKFANPFSNPYTVHVIFSNANGLRPQSSLVRIGGVNVGKVSDVSPVSSCKVNGQTEKQCEASDVTMTIDPVGLPIHKDATFAIRPRIFLEGNFFIDVHPGTPEAPIAGSGYTFPINSGTQPVQFDQFLSSLQSNTRANLQELLKQYGTAVIKGGPAYNASIQYWLPAYEYTSIVSHDFLGIQPHDLSNWIAKQGPVVGALDAHPQNLQSLITDFNTTANAFATQSTALQNAVAELPRTLSVAIPTFNSLNAAFPPLRAFARALTPGVISSGPTIDASLPLIGQLRQLVQPSELRGLASDLSVTVPALARLTVATIPLMRNGVRPLSSCVANVIYPWSQLTLNDSNFNASNGFPPHKVFVEAVDYLPGLAGETRVFDANGPYVRILGTGGTFTYSLGTPGQGKLVGNALAKIEGEQPALPPMHNSQDGAPIPVRRPPLKPTVPCETQAAITDLSAPNGGPPPTASSDHPSAKALSSKAYQALVQKAIAELKQMAKQSHMNVTFGGVPISQVATFGSGKAADKTTGGSSSGFVPTPAGSGSSTGSSGTGGTRK
jgi:phospholipid/cholesterol/gamma-HCH transport system substrate-binding protein